MSGNFSTAIISLGGLKSVKSKKSKDLILVPVFKFCPVITDQKMSEFIKVDFPLLSFVI